MQNSYSFNIFNKYSSNGISHAITEFNAENKQPVLICVGSDLVLGDSLGPLVGTLLKESGVNSFIYGTLSSPVTAKEVNLAKDYVIKTHPNSLTIAIDAAVGDVDDIGVIRVINKGLRPGLGVNKNLNEIGDVSIIGVVAARSEQNYNLFNLTRLNLVYTMASKITNGILDYLYLNNHLSYSTHLYLG